MQRIHKMINLIVLIIVCINLTVCENNNICDSGAETSLTSMFAIESNIYFGTDYVVHFWVYNSKSFTYNFVSVIDITHEKSFSSIITAVVFDFKCHDECIGEYDGCDMFCNHTKPIKNLVIVLGEDYYGDSIFKLFTLDNESVMKPLTAHNTNPILKLPPFGRVKDNKFFSLENDLNNISITGMTFTNVKTNGYLYASTDNGVYMKRINNYGKIDNNWIYLSNTQYYGLIDSNQSVYALTYNNTIHKWDFDEDSFIIESNKTVKEFINCSRNRFKTAGTFWWLYLLIGLIFLVSVCALIYYLWKINRKRNLFEVSQPSEKDMEDYVETESDSG